MKEVPLYRTAGGSVESSHTTLYPSSGEAGAGKFDRKATEDRRLSLAWVYS